MRYIAVLFVLSAFTLSSCKKELRTVVYTMDSYNNSGVTGTVSFIETNNKNIVTVKLEADGLVPDTPYLSHLHTGMPGNLTGTLIYFDKLRSPTGSVTQSQNWETTYNDAIESNTCFTIHNYTFFSNDSIGYVLAGGTGKNGK